MRISSLMPGLIHLAMHRRADIFGNTVNDFDPSRWEKWIPTTFTYLPFNGGPRICLGQQFALTEMAYLIARFMQVFERIENCENGKHPVMRSDIVLVPEEGPFIKLIPIGTQ